MIGHANMKSVSDICFCLHLHKAEFREQQGTIVLVNKTKITPWPECASEL
jgi:hypothetical protein